MPKAKVRILSNSPTDHVIDTLLIRRGSIKDLLTVVINADNTPEVVCSCKNPAEILGYLEMLKHEILHMHAPVEADEFMQDPEEPEI